MKINNENKVMLLKKWKEKYISHEKFYENIQKTKDFLNNEEVNLIIQKYNNKLKTIDAILTDYE